MTGASEICHSIGPSIHVEVKEFLTMLIAGASMVVLRCPQQLGGVRSHANIFMARSPTERSRYRVPKWNQSTTSCTACVWTSLEHIDSWKRPDIDEDIKMVAPGNLYSSYYYTTKGGDCIEEYSFILPLASDRARLSILGVNVFHQ